MRRLIFFPFYIIILFFSCNKIQSNNDVKNNISVEIQSNENSNILVYKGLSGETKNINLFELKHEFETFCSNNKTEISWDNVRILFPLYYEGSDIPQADMLFLSNSIMVLISKFYSKNLDILENRFHKYSFNNNELTVNSIDSRENVLRWLEVEKYHMRYDNVLSVDDITQTVIYNYNFKEDGFYYSGFLFSKEY